MHPILASSAIAIGRELLSLLSVRRVNPDPGNATVPDFETLLAGTNETLNDTELIQYLRTHRIHNIADLDANLLHLTRDLLNDPALAGFSHEFIREGSIRFARTKDSRIILSTTVGNGLTVNAQSPLGKLAQSIDRLLQVKEIAESNPTLTLSKIAQHLE